MFALGGEEVGPGNNFGVLLEQGTALPLGHTAPNPELDPIVQCVGPALEDHRTVSTDHRGFALGRATDEQFVRISLPATRLRHPRNPSLGFGSVCQTVSRVGRGRSRLARDCP